MNTSQPDKISRATYQPERVEKKWQKRWQEHYPQAEDFSNQPKRYLLIEFPYPSGDGLHVGHVRSYTAFDALARYSRLKGCNVLYPIGFDAFGLPTENYAIKTGRHPREVTDKNISNFERQMKKLGLSFDWSRVVDTTDPKYYQWTQWIFLQLYKKGLAYQATMPINWCPKDKIGLANEEVINGKCERCGTPVTRKLQKQWMLKITAYAERLLNDLDTVDYLPKIKAQQVNWIGKSEGAEIEFPLRVKSEELKAKRRESSQPLSQPISQSTLTVFTTRPDTIFGATYLVVSPEHGLVTSSKGQVTNWGEVEQYIQLAAKKSDLERTELAKEKTGVELKGVKAINPANGEEIPIWIADYILSTYGTGAIMAVPAHDQRDNEFAKKYFLPIKYVIEPVVTVTGRTPDKDVYDKLHKTRERIYADKEVYVDNGQIINSSLFDGLHSSVDRDTILALIEKKGFGKRAVQYKLRDWVFSRQHYWGEPIPIVHCEKCGVVPVPEDQLPVELPFVKKYEPTDTGESPLANMTEWVNTTCPNCGGPAKRETDTMPNWAGSSWYYLRYTDSQNDTAFADQKKLEYWLPVDIYNGGMEHTTLHLLYSRFWHKFLYDQGLVPTLEPYHHRHSHGIVLAEDGRKMSKSWGNVINPDDVVEEYGADSLRLYEMFMGPFEDTIPWSTKGIVGVYRFLNNVWKLYHDKYVSAESRTSRSDEIERALHKTIKKVSDDFEQFGFNTIVSSLMELSNTLRAVKPGEVDEATWYSTLRIFLIMLFPIAPHIASELWEIRADITEGGDIQTQSWPEYTPALLQAETFTLVVQINGKVRGRLEVQTGLDEAGAVAAVQADERLKMVCAGYTKVVYVPNRLINFIL